MNRCQAIKDYIKEPQTFVTIATVVVAGIVAYLSIVNQNAIQMLAAIVTILGALTLAQLIASYQSSKFRKSIERMESQLQKSYTFFTDRAALDSAGPFEKFLA